MNKFKHIDGFYWRSATKVLYGGRPTNLDPQRTKVHFGHWAVDGTIVYTDGTALRGVDASTFQPLNYLYGKDANKVVTSYSKVPADAATFEPLDSGLGEAINVALIKNHAGGYGRDSKAIYFAHILVKAADRDTFQSLGGSYGRDCKTVFFEHKKLPNANPTAWRYISSGYSTDGKRVYYKNQLMKGANAVHFTPLNPVENAFAYDGQHFYCCGHAASAAEYADALRGSAESYLHFSDSIRSNKWQRLRFQERWESREPDEDRFRVEEYIIGDSKISLDDKFGKSEVLSPESFSQYFDEDYSIEPTQQVVRWQRGNHSLVGLIDDDEIVWALIDNTEDEFTPPAAE